MIQAPVPRPDRNGNWIKQLVSWFIIFVFTGFVVIAIIAVSKNQQVIFNSFMAFFAAVGALFTILQVVPSILTHLQQSLKPGIRFLVSKKFLWILIIVMLLSSISLNVFLYRQADPPPPPLGKNTANPSITVTPTPATVPPTVSPTPTMVSTQSTSPCLNASIQARDPLPSFISGNGSLVVDDPLGNNNCGDGWDTNANCQFVGNSYRIGGTQSNPYFGCLAEGLNVTNFVVEVQMTLSPGSAGGLIFRSPPDTNGYFADVSWSGYYSISSPNQQNNTPDLKYYTRSPFISSNRPSHLVDIKMSGNQITLYVDGHEIYSVPDSTSSQDITYSRGLIGLYVTGDYGDPTASQTSATFTNLRVWNLQ